MYLIDVVCLNSFVLFQLKNPSKLANQIDSYVLKVLINLTKVETSSDNARQRRRSLEKIANHLILPHAIQRASLAYEINYRGWDSDIIRSFEMIGVHLRKKKISADSAQDDQKAKRKRCDICVGNDNKYQKTCQQCSRYCCPEHIQIITTSLCAECADI